MLTFNLSALRAVLIKDICHCFSGGTPNTSNRSYYNGHIPFLRSGDIHSDQTELFIAEKAIDESSAKMVRKGDLLFALYGATSGECDISKVDGAINQAILCIRPNDSSEIDIRYLKELLCFKKSSILSKYLQGGQGNLSAQTIMGLSIRIHDYKEQQKIADFFTALDEKIRIQLNTVDKLNAIKTGMLAKVFSYENTLDWTVRKFDEIFALNRTFPVSRDQISDECDKTSDNSKLIHYGDILTIYGNIVNPKSDSIGYLVTDVNAKDDDYLCDGDIVFANYAEDYAVGKAIELYGVNCKLLSGNNTIAARPKVTFASGYLSYFFNSPLFKSQVRTLATGTNVMFLTKSSIQTTSISFPSIEEQKKISNLLNTLDNKIAVCNKKLEALKQLKKAFMQRMFV